MKSVGIMIDRLDGLLGTKDLSTWETQFVSDISERTGCGIRTTGLSEKQIEVVERIYAKHFGD